jgi:hypothetical protein
VISAKQYGGPEAFAGKRVLVVGGGVSGADIAAELGEAGMEVHWSVRRKALFLPRVCGTIYNDALFSYVGRIAAEEMTYGAYIALLERIVPDHIASCRQAGMLPESGFHNAIHINDRIVPAVANGLVELRAATASVDADAQAIFADGSSERYDVVIGCVGYGMPDYSFIEGFAREDLYEHFIFWREPTLAIINTPVDTEAFGTACPYFEAIAAWVLRTFDGTIALPSDSEMAAWCNRHMHNLEDRRFYDCWLETIRLGLMSGTVPNPATHFADYWALISGTVEPSRLAQTSPIGQSCPYDDPATLAALRLRILSTLTDADRAYLAGSGQISWSEAQETAGVSPERKLDPVLPYRMRSERSRSRADHRQDRETTMLASGC